MFHMCVCVQLEEVRRGAGSEAGLLFVYVGLSACYVRWFRVGDVTRGRIDSRKESETKRNEKKKAAAIIHDCTTIDGACVFISRRRYSRVYFLTAGRCRRRPPVL